MRRGWIVAAVLAAGTPAAAQNGDSNTIFGDAAACGPNGNGTAVLARVNGFRDRAGNLRIAIYRAREDEYLASGKFVARIDTPMTSAGPMTVCARVPEPGPYIVIALHDRNADGRLNAWSDGFGFSNNPKLGISKPAIDLVKVNLVGIVPLGIILNYAQGLSARPWPTPTK